ncbi:MAG: FAD-dependent oxidoreductase [Bacteroidota bacterium]
MKRSYWESEAWPLQPDIVIIGAGLVGINAAISLKKQKPRSNILVLDQSPFPAGASTRNAGFACIGSPTELLDDLQHQSETTVFDLVARRWRGLQYLRERVGDAVLQYRPTGGYEVFKAADAASFQASLQALPDLNASMQRIIPGQEAFVNKPEVIDQQGLRQVQHIIGLPLEGQLHPGFMMRALHGMASDLGIQIAGGTEVLAWETDPQGGRLHIRNAPDLRVAQVVFAVNGFARRLLPDLPIHPARNQVLLSAPIPELQLDGVFHYQSGYGYFRNVGNRILIGGLRHLDKETETTDQYGDHEKIQQELKSFFETVISPFPGIPIDQRWSGILGVGAQKMPIMQEISSGVWAALRLGGMGVALGAALGHDVAMRLLR